MKLYYTTYDNKGTHCDKTTLEKGYEELMFHVLTWVVDLGYNIKQFNMREKLIVFVGSNDVVVWTWVE